MYEVIQFDIEEKYVEDFLNLPEKLYTPRNRMQNRSQEEQILLGKHVLNKYFKQYKVLVYKEKKPVGRCVVTHYHNSQIAYIGYFECEDDSEAAKLLFEKAEELVKALGLTKIQGPVDSSFWIKYRLKMDCFDRRPYTDEPYNLEYYPRLFKENGYRVVHTYTSKQYDKVLEGDFKLEKSRYEKAVAAGYRFVSPKPEEYEKVLGEIYELVAELFSDFPIYNEISKEDFCEIFRDFKAVIDWRIVKIVYFENKAVAFSLGLPDYNNLVYGKIGLKEIMTILAKKIRSSNYVMLYMGVKPEHRGLGRPLVYEMAKFVKERHSLAIGALQGENKKTNEYAKDKIDILYTYCMLEKEL